MCVFFDSRVRLAAGAVAPLRPGLQMGEVGEVDHLVRQK